MYELFGILVLGAVLLYITLTWGVGISELKLKRDLDNVESDFDKLLKDVAELQEQMEKDGTLPPEPSSSEEDSDPEERRKDELRKAVKEEKQLRRRQLAAAAVRLREEEEARTNQN